MSLLDFTILPDYDAYELIFYNSQYSSFIIFGWEPFFILLNNLFSEYEYTTFRFFINIASLFFIIYSIISAYLFFSSEKNVRYWGEVICLIITLFSISVCLFEFFSVRIRAGLCVSLFFFGITFLITSSKKSFIGKCFLYFSSFLFLIFSGLTHFSTFIVLTLYLLVPCIIIKVNNIRFSGLTMLKNAILFFWVFLGLFVFVIAILSLSSDRGEHLYSEINPARVIMTSVVPIFIFLFFGFRVVLNAMREFFNVNFKSLFKDDFDFLVTLFYLVINILITIFYFSGVIGGAGEAVVRVLTLSSVVGFFIMCNTKPFYFLFWLYILTINGLFFLNTLYGSA